MSPDDHQPAVSITDPRRIRALAHPVRLALLEALTLAGSLTATQAAERINESPTTCSFHLRQLAKYGFVEETGEGKGRNRPWRTVHLGLSFSSTEGSTEHRLAVDALERMLIDRLIGRLEGWLRTRHGYPKEWQDAADATQSILYVTPAELKAISAEVMSILLRYTDRIRDPSLRPPGALLAEMVAFAYPVSPQLEDS
jgi:DNA-binding transcriptional ArsR family regulator